jgi:ketosteroid isomerase-like protein
MSTERHKDLVRWHLDLSWNKGDYDALDHVWATDALVHLPAGRTIEGLAALKQHLRTSVGAYADRLLTIDDLVAEGATAPPAGAFGRSTRERRSG